MLIEGERFAFIRWFAPLTTRTSTAIKWRSRPLQSSANGSAFVDDGDEQYFLAVVRQADHSRHAGHHARFIMSPPNRAKLSGEFKDLPLFGSKVEVHFAYDDGGLKTHDRIRLSNPDFWQPTVFGNADKKVIETTVGRVIFSESGRTNWVSRTSRSKIRTRRHDLEVLQICRPRKKPFVMLDKLKSLAPRSDEIRREHRHDDMIVPKERDEQIDNAQSKSRSRKNNIARCHHAGERYNKNVDI